MKGLILILGLITSFAYAQSKAGFYVVGGKIITVQDTSSQKYLKAVENAGVVPSIIQNFASNFLVTTERAIGSYSLMKAQYPFIGGTGNTHSLNMNDPRMLDAAFRLVYSGTITHSANGMQGDGSTGYANTFINGTTLSPNNIHLSFYSNINRSTTADQREMGFEINPFVSPGNYAELIIRRFSDQSVSVLGNDNNVPVFTNTDSRGYYIANRRSSTVNNLLKNGIIVASSSVSNTQTYPNANLYLMAINNTSTGTIAPINYSTLRAGLITIGSGFTSTQETQQSKIATAFNGFLSRQ